LPAHFESIAGSGLLSVRQTPVLSVSARIAFMAGVVPGAAGPVIVFLLTDSLLNHITD